MISIDVTGGFDAWRAQARDLLRARVPHNAVLWTTAGDAQTSFFTNAPHATTHTTAHTIAAQTSEMCTADVVEVSTDFVLSPIRVSRAFLELARTVACHRDADRWSLLYRTLFRITHGEEPHLLKIETDADVRRLRQMEKAVARDVHKMHAFVRFRSVQRADGEWFVAWHRPDHFITEQVAGWFADRFAPMRWSILTPDASAHWNTRALTFGAGLSRQDAAIPEDELEDLWLTYYASIFNPARLKTNAMVKEMPVRHWETLPETRLIPDLIRRAAAREQQMRRTQPASAAAFLPPAEARTLPRLAEAIKDCRGCELYCAATRAVFGEGAAEANVMFVGEQPGDEEDKAGRPFVGAAGQVLNQAMLAAGIRREAVYVTNAVKHFKFDLRGDFRQHRSPDAGEVAACQPWLDAEIENIQPRLIVCLGATAALSVTGVRLKILDHRGRFIPHHKAGEVFLTVHPSYVLRQPDAQAQAAEFERFVADLRLVRLWLERDAERPAKASGAHVYDEQLTTTR